MFRVLIVLAVLGLAVYAFFDVLRTPASGLPYLRKPLWMLACLVPVVGAVAWFWLGRPGGQLPGRRSGPIAPDDDPAFLRRLEEEAWRRRMQERRRAAGGEAGDGTTPAT